MKEYGTTFSVMKFYDVTVMAENENEAELMFNEMTEFEVEDLGCLTETDLEFSNIDEMEED